MSNNGEEPRVGSTFGSIEPEGSGFDELVSPQQSVASPQWAPLPQKPRRRSRTPLILGMLAVILVGAIGFFGYMAWDAHQERQKAEEIAQQEQQQEQEKAEAIEAAESPFSVLVGSVDPPSEDPLEVVVAENQLRAGASTLSIVGGELKPTVNGCTLIAITDICLGARASLGEGGFDVLVVKDISRTRILDDPSDFKEIKTDGGTIAASLTIDMGEGAEPAKFGALTSSGTTGFVLIFPEGTSAERVEEVLSAATVIG